MRVQIWIALLEIATLFLVVPHLSGESRLARLQTTVAPASNWLMNSWRIDVDSVDLGRWAWVGFFMLAVSWLILALQLRLRWFLLAPAILVVATPAAVMAARYLAGIAPERRNASFLGGCACFLAAKLLMIAGALSQG